MNETNHEPNHFVVGPAAYTAENVKMVGCNQLIGQPDYRPAPETVARIAELLALTWDLDATGPAEVAAVRNEIVTITGSLMREQAAGRDAPPLRDHIAALVAREREILAAIAAAAPHYRRARQLAFHLAMELPVGLWRAVARGASSPDTLGRYAAVDAVRDAAGIEGQITSADQFWATPGMNRPPNAA